MRPPKPSLAALNAFSAAARMLPPTLQRQLVLVGGAAMAAQGIWERETHDVDITLSRSANQTLRAAIGQASGGCFGWSKRGRRKCLTWGPQTRHPVYFDLVEVGRPTSPRLPRAESSRWCDGFVATLPELLLNKARAVMTRDKLKDGVRVDRWDFELLLTRATIPPWVESRELEFLKKAIVKVRGVSREQAEFLLYSLMHR